MSILKVITWTMLYSMIETSFSNYEPVTNFEDLVKSPYFVDKTLLLKTYFEDLKNVVNHTMIICPRKFGKTTNLKMLKFFAQLEVNESNMVVDPEHTKAYQVFKNLQIGKHKDIIKTHLAQYPVLYLDLGNVLINASNPKEIFANLRRQISICCSEYLYVQEHIKKLNLKRKLWSSAGTQSLLYYVDKLIYGTPTRGEIRKCLLRMAELLYFHFKRRVIVLVDGLSGTITDTMLFRVYWEREMFRFMVPGMLKDFYYFDSHFLHSIMITGHSSIGLPSYFYEYANFRHYHFLENHHYSEYYGFTQHQTQLLFDRFTISKQNRTRFKNFYQGYATRNASLILYNPCWVIEYLQNNRYVLVTPEFVQHDDTEAPENVYLYSFMHHDEFRLKIVDLIENKATIALEKQYDAVARERFVYYRKCHKVVYTYPVPIMFSYIFERGYLTHTKTENVFTVANSLARRPLIYMMYWYYLQNFKLFDTLKEGMDFLLKNPEKSGASSTRKLKLLFDQIMSEMLKKGHQSLEDEFHAMLLASAAPRGNLLNDDGLMLKINYTDRICIRRPNIVMVNSKESFACIVIVRFNSTLSVSEIIQVAENHGFYNDRGIRTRKIMVFRIDQNWKTTVDERIDVINS